MSAIDRNLLGAAVALAILSFAGRSNADADAPTALAQSLFDDAVHKMEEGDFGAACPLLERSQELDPASGTALDLGYCHERSGAPARAFTAYEAARKYAVIDGRSDREARARKKLDELALRVGLVRIMLGERARADSAEIALDERALSSSDLEGAQALDPGRHVLVARAGGAIRFEQRVDAVAGAATVVHVDWQSPTLATHAKTEETSRSASTEAPKGNGRRQLAIVSGIAGLTLLGLGGTSGLLALNRHAESDSRCDDVSCPPDAVSAEREASIFAWGANIGIGLGVVAVGVATYLFVTSSSRARPTASFPVGVRF